VGRVFLSHSGKDDKLSSELHAWLAEHHEVFLDKHQRDGITTGDEWEERLYERLRWADVVVCAVTSNHVSSRWCFAEVAIAKALGRRLLPLTAEVGVRHPLLEPIQHADPRGWA